MDRDFEALLRREVDRVLADPAFQRSPVQSRLLGYLCDQTIARNQNLSQFSVAVDGLGRPETVDQLTESYPRVQISRLRRNLSLYYARCAPGEGLAVFIRHGDYQLRLAPPENAYSEQRPRAAPPLAANDPVSARPAPEPEPAAPAAASAARWRWRWQPRPLAAAVVAGLALAAGSVWLSNRLAGDVGAKVPSLDVEMGDPGDGAARDPLITLAARQALDIANNSYVVRNPRPQEASNGPGYTVRINRSIGVNARPVLEVSLFDRANRRLYHDSIPIGADRSALFSRLNGTLLQMFNPAGAIAKRELAGIGDEPRTDYECVLRTETDRLQGGLSTDLVESCLRRFPQSQYRAYWFSRMAFMGYREQVLSGGQVEPAGEPWRYLQRALAADATNPFANYMAAKVSFSRGDCGAARPYFDRTMVNGNFSAVLLAATVSESALCPGSLTHDDEAEARLVSLVEAIPDPNPLLYVYLIFATAAVDRPDLAGRLLATRISENPDGSMADIHAALHEALAGPAGFEAHRDRLQRVVDGFYWEPTLRRSMMDKLAAVAASRG